MVSSLHEVLSEVFRQCPALAADLLQSCLGVRMPDYDGIRVESGDLPEHSSTERRADAVVALYDAHDRAILVVVIEVQLRRDRRKRYSWQQYLASARARHCCPALLLVVCAEESVAQWCAHPNPMGHPTWVLRHLVLGPSRVPLVSDTMLARDHPELSVLSALAHGGDPAHQDVLRATLDALEHIDVDQATFYADVIARTLPAAVENLMEEIMSVGTYEPKSPILRRLIDMGLVKGREEGHVEGELEALYDVLEARAIQLSDEHYERIDSCTDSSQLRSWIRRASTAKTVDDVMNG